MIVQYCYKKQVAKNVYSFYFLPSNPVRFIAGQFITLTIDHAQPDDRGIERWFTLSSSPTENLLAITVRLNKPSSSFKKALINLQKGINVRISEPMGDFVLPKNQHTELFFIAFGVGITPYRSMVRWMTDKNETRNIQLIYISNHDQTVMFEPVFNKPYIDIKILMNSTATINNIVEMLLKKDSASTQAYISGPEIYVENLVLGLKNSGYDTTRLITDYYQGYQDS